MTQNINQDSHATAPAVVIHQESAEPRPAHSNERQQERLRDIILRRRYASTTQILDDSRRGRELDTPLLEKAFEARNVKFLDNCQFALLRKLPKSAQKMVYFTPKGILSTVSKLAPGEK